MAKRVARPGPSLIDRGHTPRLTNACTGFGDWRWDDKNFHTKNKFMNGSAGVRHILAFATPVGYVTLVKGVGDGEFQTNDTRI